MRKWLNEMQYYSDFPHKYQQQGNFEYQFLYSKDRLFFNFKKIEIKKRERDKGLLFSV